MRNFLLDQLFNYVLHYITTHAFIIEKEMEMQFLFFICGLVFAKQIKNDIDKGSQKWKFETTYTDHKNKKHTISHAYLRKLQVLYGSGLLFSERLLFRCLLIINTTRFLTIFASLKTKSLKSQMN